MTNFFKIPYLIFLPHRLQAQAIEDAKIEVIDTIETNKQEGNNV